MSKKPDDKKETIETPAEPVAPVAPIATPAAPISIMGEPKPVKDESVTLKSFTELKAAFESLENKINQFIPKAPTETPAPPPPTPKTYRLFDEFEV